MFARFGARAGVCWAPRRLRPQGPLRDAEPLRAPVEYWKAKLAVSNKGNSKFKRSSVIIQARRATAQQAPKTAKCNLKAARTASRKGTKKADVHNKGKGNGMAKGKGRM